MPGPRPKSIFSHGEICQGACKPGSVPIAVSPRGPAARGQPFVSAVRCRAAQAANPGLSGRNAPAFARDPYLALLRVGFAVRALLPAPRCALTAPFQPYLSKRGGLLSVALSLRLPAAGVTRHPCFVEPGLSSNTLRCTRLPGPLASSYLVRPRSRSKSNRKRIARTCPSTSPSIFSGRQRRWNASTALCPSVTS